MSDDETTTNKLDELMEFMENGRVIPVISNSFRLEEIFRQDGELHTLMAEEPQFYDELPTLYQQLTKKWAEKIKYPMSDNHNLARVAQYRQVDKGEGARREYIKFLVDRLIEINEADEKFKEVANSLKSREKETGKSPSLSYTVEKLGYPRFTNGTMDPLKLLAKLPVKIYITTSYSDFLESALKLEDKKPRTQLCFCKKSTVDPSFLPDRDFRPDADHPAVVHLFGLEQYSNTLVLSEDDHINFLLSAVEEINSPDVYPSYLRGALPEASLFLLGYHLRDWDFRTLFRFILKIRKSESYGDVTTSIAIQFKPRVRNEDNKNATLAYLNNYFGSRKFQVWWSETDEFIYDLWNAWERYNPNKE
jgi:hypothetical protein